MTPAQYRSSRSNKLGQTGEELARYLLQRLGLAMVEPVHTPWRILRDPAGRIASAYPVEKVSGDIRAVAPGGRSVLAEVKVRDHNLRWTDLEPHQRQALSQHHDLGGLSLLVWLHTSDSYILPWPLPDFGPRLPLTPTQAAALTLHHLPT